VPRERTLDGLAHANAKRLVGPELFAETVSALILISGKMAKVMESTDHMEDGNPRALMKPLVLQMAGIVLGSLGCMAGSIEADVRKRLTEVEQKSIFWRADANPAQ
jgi:hypothetical protein